MISPPITLRIAEARTKDVGRAIARIDPQEFSKIRVDMGNTVALKSKKAETVMKVMPAYPEMRGQKIIQIDGIGRENLGTGLDEKIEVYKVPARDARTIVVTPLNSGESFQKEDGNYLAEILDGTPIIKGNKIRALLFGTKFQDFLVEDTDPEGAVLIRQFTSIKSMRQC